MAYLAACVLGQHADDLVQVDYPPCERGLRALEHPDAQVARARAVAVQWDRRPIEQDLCVETAQIPIHIAQLTVSLRLSSVRLRRKRKCDVCAQCACVCV